MLILGIETSCDETAVAVVRNGTEVQSNAIASSQQAFERSGGVIPEQAARKQIACMNPVLQQALDEADIRMNDIDAIAVTCGPGLSGSLLVGTTCARTLASIYSTPLIPVHHTLGHLSSTWLDIEDDIPQFPILTLSVSGGHSDVWLRTSHTKGVLLGRTLDDAAGEAFDKGAVQLGLPYPGGPAIAKAAEHGNPQAYSFPLPLKNKEGYNFSFSGLKTALKYLLEENNMCPPVSTEHPKHADVTASYQHALCAHLFDRLQKVTSDYSDIQEIHIVGGVSANTYLRSMTEELGSIVRYPKKIRYCTDNAAMIAAAGFFLWEERKEKAYDRNFITTSTIQLSDAVSN